ncbi:hypothetical protein ABEB36_011698 [Hypothenemus hampei]|uniref:Uncharacterized protein n=1 Tax=Hypothenemus hampei TaxID=57062 RepID=A0ABD1EAT4_HYPHA
MCLNWQHGANPQSITMAEISMNKIYQGRNVRHLFLLQERKIKTSRRALETFQGVYLNNFHNLDITVERRAGRASKFPSQLNELPTNPHPQSPFTHSLFFQTGQIYGATYFVFEFTTCLKEILTPVNLATVQQSHFRDSRTVK